MESFEHTPCIDKTKKQININNRKERRKITKEETHRKTNLSTTTSQHFFDVPLPKTIPPFPI
jgi:hypothetical protein